MAQTVMLHNEVTMDARIVREVMSALKVLRKQNTGTYTLFMAFMEGLVAHLDAETQHVLRRKGLIRDNGTVPDYVEQIIDAAQVRKRSGWRLIDPVRQ